MKATRKIQEINRRIDILNMVLIYTFLLLLNIALGLYRIAALFVLVPLLVLTIRAVYNYSKSVFKF